MHMLLKSWHRLLADIGESRGVLLDPPYDLPLSWVLVEGPKLDKQLLQYLEHGEPERPTFPEWLLPLWEAFVAERDPCVLRDLRQVLVFCYKAEFEPTNDQIRDAEMRFEDAEAGIQVWDDWFKSLSYHDLALFRLARQTVGRVIYAINWREIVPSHGPGAVFPSRLPCDKSYFSVMYPKLNSYYPYDQFFCGLPSFWKEVMVDEITGPLTEEDRIRCRLIPVPKDSRGPRLICVHPTEAIWIQQGQRRLLENAIAHSPVCSGKINFHDQTVNGSLALSASLTREYCTLDLKDASDRMSSELVHYLFGGAYEFLASSRADEVILSDGRIVSLRKFAPMGNCLTFPVQSLVFLSLVRAGIRQYHGTICDNVYVFGDDIIFPTKFYNGAVAALVRAGFVPNPTKTYRLGSFRESCGVDAFNGTNITPYRIRRAGITSVSDAVSLCDLARRLSDSGKQRCSSYLYCIVREWLLSTYGLSLPISNNRAAQGLYEYVKDARTVFLYGQTRFNRDIQQWQSRVLLVRDRLMTITNGEWFHLQDSLLRLRHCQSPYSDRRTEYPVPHRERLSCGWTELVLSS